MEPAFEALPLRGLTDCSTPPESGDASSPSGSRGGGLLRPVIHRARQPLRHGDTMLIVTGKAEGQLACVIPFRLARERSGCARARGGFRSW